MNDASSSYGLSITLKDFKSGYFPLETVEGIVSWNLHDSPQKVLVSLRWETRGKGIPDTQIVASTQTDGPVLPADTLRFAFQLPQEPYSLSGQLISIIWTLQATVPGTELVQSQEIILSPTGQEIVVARLSDQ